MNIGILGGDLRIIFLAKMLAKDDNKIYTYGVDQKMFSNTKIIECNSLKEVSENCRYIISSIPFTKDGENINSPFSTKEINIKECLKILKDTTLIAGAIPEQVKKEAERNNIAIIDLMDIESFTILNVIPTVEGAIQIAMENTRITIHNSNCLVLGFGRIGKLLSKTLKDLGANVNVEARRDSDLAWIKLYGYKEINLNHLNENFKMNRYDIIFNTIPSVILNDEKLKILKENNNDVVIIELASKPWGIDFEKAKEYNINVVSAQGLPGKVAPLTAAKYIKETIDKIII